MSRQGLRHFLSFAEYTRHEIEGLLAQASLYKRERRRHPKPLAGKILGMIFEKSSTRTRVSFEVAMLELGGTTITLEGQGSQLGRGESYADTARVLSRYVDFIAVRTFEHDRVLELARHASVPVVNALTDLCHPCQLLADLLTIREEGLAPWRNLCVAYVGDMNNMAYSWVEAALLLGFTLRLASPQGYPLPASLSARLPRRSSVSHGHDPLAAVTGAHVVTTDTWFSMGQTVSAEKQARFEPFQVHARLMALAHPKAIFLHCLPAHRGEEVTAELIDGPRSRVFSEAENRLHVQKAVLGFLAAGT